MTVLFLNLSYSVLFPTQFTTIAPRTLLSSILFFSVEKMAESLCGPSNPIQAFRKETSLDKTLQQDHIVSTQPLEQVSFASSVLTKSDARTVYRGFGPSLALIQVSSMLSSKHFRRDIRFETIFNSTSVIPMALYLQTTRPKM